MYSGEKLNSITHLIGAVFALVGFGALLAVGIMERSFLLVVAYALFGLTLVMLYTMSTLYHSIKAPGLKRLFQKLDHVSIYLLIAGTYTPYMLVSLPKENGLLLLAVVWCLAIIGILLDVLGSRRNELLQISLYLIMGWLCTFKYDELKASLPAAGLWWLTAGGLFYTVGIIFYILDDHNKLRHAHGIWHLFVLSGSVCHFISVIIYVR